MLIIIPHFSTPNTHYLAEIEIYVEFRSYWYDSRWIETIRGIDNNIIGHLYQSKLQLFFCLAEMW